MARVKRKCEKPTCGKEIPLYHGMGGAGFESIQTIPQPQVQVGGAGGAFVPQPNKHLELCKECYLVEFQEKYAGKPLPKLPQVLPEDDE